MFNICKGQWQFSGYFIKISAVAEAYDLESACMVIISNFFHPILHSLSFCMAAIGVVECMIFYPAMSYIQHTLYEIHKILKG